MSQLCQQQQDTDSNQLRQETPAIDDQENDLQFRSDNLSKFGTSKDAYSESDHPVPLSSGFESCDNNGNSLNTTKTNLFLDQQSKQRQQNYQQIVQMPANQLLAYFENYQLHNAELINMSQLKSDQNIRLKRYKQSLFYGIFLNNKRHGKGIMIYGNGRLFEGDWENDLKHGRGYEVFPNGSFYEGQYVNGKPEGVGTYNYANGEIYDGQWLSGMKHGSGIWRGTKNDSYIGEWKFGKADGYGVHTWINGDRYEGQFKGCLKHGEGTEKFANGDVYVGSYVNGKPEGYGEYYWNNGSFFKGYFKNGLRHGSGIWKRGSNAADTYEGEYVNDKKCGQGIFTWASGNTYKGFYFDDLRHGYGEMYWTDGSYYKGFWERGIQHGEGEMCMPGEDPKRGIFEFNVFIGEIDNENNTINQQTPKAVQLAQQKLFVSQQQNKKSGILSDQLYHDNNSIANLQYSPIKKNQLQQKYLPQSYPYNFKHYSTHHSTRSSQNQSRAKFEYQDNTNPHLNLQKIPSRVLQNQSTELNKSNINYQKNNAQYTPMHQTRQNSPTLNSISNKGRTSSQRSQSLNKKQQKKQNEFSIKKCIHYKKDTSKWSTTSSEYGQKTALGGGGSGQAASNRSTCSSCNRYISQARKLWLSSNCNFSAEKDRKSPNMLKHIQ